jgi:hypothetical protein
MKTFLLATFAFLATNFASAHDHPGAHLSFANGALHAHASWVQGPHSPEESVLRLEWKNGADHSATEPPGRLRVTLWMPEHNHGSAPTQIQRVLGDSGQPLVGVYLVSNVFFTMGGVWEVRVSLKYSDGKEETKNFAVTLDGGGHDHH